MRGRSERWATRPSLDEVAAIAGQATTSAVPIFREVMADLETPVSAFLKIRGSGPAFLLESIEGGERLARYSFIGSDPIAVLTMRAGVATLETVGGQRTTTTYDDPLVPLANLVASRRAPEMPDLPLPRFTGGAVGYLSYEAVRAFEPRVPSAPGPGLDLPDGVWMLDRRAAGFDHLARTIKAVAHVPLGRRRCSGEAYDRAEARIDELITRLRTEQPAMPVGGELSAIPPKSARSRIPLGSDIWRWLRRRGNTLRPGISSRSFSRSASMSPAMSTHSRSIVPANDQPVAVHVLSRFRRSPDRRRVA